MIEVDAITADMTLYQGDSDYFDITDIATDRIYFVYFQFYNSNRKKIGPQIEGMSDNEGKCSLFIPSDVTNLLTVPKSKTEETYYYGVKFCYEEPETGRILEHTQILGNKQLGDLNEVTVYPLQAEGL